MSNEIETKPEVKFQGHRRWWEGIAQYMHEVWVEVRPKNGRVTWPTWESVVLSTKVVIFSSIFVGLFIGLADFLFSQAYTLIIGNGGSGIG